MKASIDRPDLDISEADHWSDEPYGLLGDSTITGDPSSEDNGLLRPFIGTLGADGIYTLSFPHREGITLSMRDDWTLAILGPGNIQIVNRFEVQIQSLSTDLCVMTLTLEPVG
jgi:hypothetical protein